MKKFRARPPKFLLTESRGEFFGRFNPAASSTFQDVDLGVTPAAIAQAHPWGIESSNLSCTWNSIANAYVNCTLSPTIPVGNYTIIFSLADHYSNSENNVADNVIITCSANNGGACPFGSVSASTPTTGYGAVNAPAYNFPTGTYTVAATNGGQSIGALTFSTSTTAVVPSYMTDIYVSTSSGTYGPYSGSASNNNITNPTTINTQAGSNVTISGVLVDSAGNPVPNWDYVVYAAGGTGSGEAVISTNSSGAFSVTVTPMEAGGGNAWHEAWASTGYAAFNQPLNVTPAPINDGGQVNIMLNAENVGAQLWITNGAEFNAMISTFDAYGNAISGTATLTTPLPSAGGTSPQTYSCTLTSGTCVIGPISVGFTPGDWPINVTVADQYGDTKSVTVYENIE